MVSCGFENSASEQGKVSFVRDGKSVGVIVLAENADESIKEAAEQFVSIVEESTGVRLPVISENEVEESESAVLYIGETAATKAAGLQLEALEPESYQIATKGNSIFIIGNDLPSATGKPTSRPTLWALNRFLEQELGVRWLWPGKLGTHIPKHPEFAIPATNLTYQPELLIRSLRMSFSPEQNIGSSDPAVEAIIQKEARLWAETHQVGRRGDIRFGHAFGDWWEKYSESHPDYFAELPEKYPQPYPKPNYVKLELSNPAVIEQIAEEYSAAGKPKYWNVCPNDGSGFSTSEETRSWDIPADQPVEGIIRGQTNLTARYVEFWNRLYKRLVDINPEVVLTTYAYSAYRFPPPPERPLTAKAILGIVDSYNAYDMWREWASYDTQLVLRPNWWHQGGDAPYLPLKKTADYLHFAAEHDMIGLDMDSIIGYWATQGLNYYTTARLMTSPELSLDTIIEEYCSAFGPAASTIKSYFEYWQALTDEYNYPLNAVVETDPQPSKFQELADAKKIPSSILNGSKYVLPFLYDDTVLARPEQLLKDALETIGNSDPIATQRVQFLQSGLDSLRMTRNQIELGQQLKNNPTPELQAAFQKGSDELNAFRNQLSPTHAIWGQSMTRHEDRYKVLIRPENASYHKINLDGF